MLKLLKAAKDLIEAQEKRIEANDKNPPKALDIKLVHAVRSLGDRYK